MFPGAGYDERWHRHSGHAPDSLDEGSGAESRGPRHQGAGCVCRHDQEGGGHGAQ